jgi:hypothetical protein
MASVLIKISGKNSLMPKSRAGTRDFLFEPNYSIMAGFGKELRLSRKHLPKIHPRHSFSYNQRTRQPSNLSTMSNVWVLRQTAVERGVHPISVVMMMIIGEIKRRIIKVGDRWH